MRYSVLPAEKVADVRDLIRAFCVETCATPDIEEFTINGIQNGLITAFIATDNEKVIGVLGFRKFPESYLGDLFYVIPECRGKLVGGRLHNMVKKEAKTHGVHKLIVLATGEQSQKYYKVGYKHKWHVLEMEV